MYVDFWEIPESDPRSIREGVYFEKKISHKNIDKQLQPLSSSISVVAYLVPASIINHAGVLVLPKHALDNVNIALALTGVLWSLAAYLLLKAFNSK